MQAPQPVDFTKAKYLPGSSGGVTFPPGTVYATWPQLVPLVGPRDLRDEFLFGIPLQSAVRDPETRQPQKLTDVLLDKFVAQAVADVEATTRCAVLPQVVTEKAAFDRHEYHQMGYFRLMRRPVYAMLDVTVQLSNEQDIYVVPLEWVDCARMTKGQLNLIPIAVALRDNATVLVPESTNNGVTFLSFLSSRNFVPSFWRLTYAVGWPDGQVPALVRHLVGTTAAIKVLSLLAATNRHTGASVGIDGMSQSSSGPGPNVFTQRCQELMADQKRMVGQVKAMFGTKFFVGGI